MMHFLARLVARTRGTAPQVEPIIAPRFAPIDAPGTASLSEIPSEISSPLASPQLESKPAPQPGKTRPVDEHLASRGESRHSETTGGEVVNETLLAPQRVTGPEGERPVWRPDNARGEETNIEVDTKTLLVPHMVKLPPVGGQSASRPESPSGEATKVEPNTETLLMPQSVKTPPVDEQHASGSQNGRDKSTRAEVDDETLLVPQFLTRRSPRIPGQSDRPVETGVEARGTTAAPTIANSTRQRRDLPQPGIRPPRVAHNDLRFSADPQNQAPVVHVTIGRIEVRAVHEPQPTPRKSQRNPGPKLTLDRYLKERKEGKR